jgi:hypothetical protein
VDLGYVFLQDAALLKPDFPENPCYTLLPVFRNEMWVESQQEVQQLHHHAEDHRAQVCPNAYILPFVPTELERASVARPTHHSPKKGNDLSHSLIDFLQSMETMITISHVSYWFIAGFFTFAAGSLCLVGVEVAGARRNGMPFPNRLSAMRTNLQHCIEFWRDTATVSIS